MSPHTSCKGKARQGKKGKGRQWWWWNDGLGERVSKRERERNTNEQIMDGFEFGRVSEEKRGVRASILKSKLQLPLKERERKHKWQHNFQSAIEN